MDWQPIGTIPRDGHTVALLSATHGEDVGRWYFFMEEDWAAKNAWWSPLDGMEGDTSGDLDTDCGFGDYTHWREMEDIHL